MFSKFSTTKCSYAVKVLRNISILIFPDTLSDGEMLVLIKSFKYTFNRKRMLGDLK